MKEFRRLPFQAVAAAGLLLVGINIVIGKTGLRNVRGYAGAGAGTELRKVFNPEHVVIGQPPEEKYEASPSSTSLRRDSSAGTIFFPIDSYVPKVMVIGMGAFGKTTLGARNFSWGCPMLKSPIFG
jgi:hypothetical protein